MAPGGDPTHYDLGEFSAAYTKPDRSKEEPSVGRDVDARRRPASTTRWSAREARH